MTDAAARIEVARTWGKSSLPDQAGRDTTAILAAAAAGELGALVVAGVDPADLPDPQAALAAIEMSPFVVSLELRASEVTDRADVVFPVAAVAEKAGTFVNWEGRGGSFGAALPVPEVRTDLYVLGAIADQMDVHLGLPDAAAARAELAALGTWHGPRPEPPVVAQAWPGVPPADHVHGSGVLDVRLATWHQLLDSGRMQDGEPSLAGTARPVAARMSAATAAEAGVADGDKVTVASEPGIGDGSGRGRADGGPRGLAAGRRAARGGPAGGRPAGAFGRRPVPRQPGARRPHQHYHPRPTRCGPRRHGHAEEAGMMDQGALRQVLAAPRPDPTLASFNQLIWWMVLLKVAIVFVFLLVTTILMIWFERRVIGRMQSRPGPNRAGPFGLLQPVADALKLPLKEDIIPLGADKLVFVLAPVISGSIAFVAFSVIPWGPEVSIFHHYTPLQLTDLPVAVLLILAMSSVGVYGIVLAGWASGSPYSLLGALRSVAQVISYEIAMGLAFVAVFLYAGSLSTTAIVNAQQHEWYAWLLPVSFVVYLFTMVGETNRLPFDLAEDEGALVAGYHTEYSSMKFAMFYLAEYINMITVSALATTLFLGGWRAPWPLSLWSGANSGWWPLLWFLIKVFIFLFCYVWLRGTLPRVRYDQLMALGWKVLIPVSIVWILLIATVRAWRLDSHSPAPYVVFGVVIVLILALAWMWDSAAQRRALLIRRAEGRTRPGPGPFRLGLPGAAAGPAALPRRRP